MHLMISMKLLDILFHLFQLLMEIVTIIINIIYKGHINVQVDSMRFIFKMYEKHNEKMENKSSIQDLIKFQIKIDSILYMR